MEDVLYSFLFGETTYRIRHKWERLRRDILILVDTSGSMFARIGESLKERFGDRESGYLAVEYALGAAVNIIIKALERGTALDGHLGFFSAKTEDFVCGPTPTCLTLGEYIKLEDKPYVDYLSLKDTTIGVAKTFKRSFRINTTSEGTDPNPLLHYLVKRYDYDFIAIITDGYVDEIVIPVYKPTLIVITPEGTTDVKVRGGRVKIKKLD